MLCVSLGDGALIPDPVVCLLAPLVCHWASHPSLCGSHPQQEWLLLFQMLTVAERNVCSVVVTVLFGHERTVWTAEEMTFHKDTVEIIGLRVGRESHWASYRTYIGHLHTRSKLFMDIGFLHRAKVECKRIGGELLICLIANISPFKVCSPLALQLIIISL